MPWKITAKEEARRVFVELWWRGKTNVAAACRRFGISRQCGYRWLERAKEEGSRRLEDRSHQTKAAAELRRRWLPRVLEIRRKAERPGAAQIRWHLQQRYRLGPWPSVRTIGRWLRDAGLTKQRRRPAPHGPAIERCRRVAEAPNDVWTVDFKGWFCTGDGQRVCALTVRDLASRYVLLVRHLERTSEPHVRAAFTRLFKRYGVPRAIRTDNGPPFGGEGPHGWSTLAVWWVRLGIEVEHSRPACPQDNAEHEQMHGVLKRQTASPAAPTVAAQQRRFDRWRDRYNHQRPHQSLHMHPPASLYCRSPRSLQLQTWTYPADCELKQANARGLIRWRKRSRLIGQAFAHQFLALKPVAPDIVAVHFGSHLLGLLHATDRTAIRAVRSKTAGRLSASPASPPLNLSEGGAAPLPQTLPNLRSV
jgi:putative transposase